jgi:hypothetical protein
MVRKEPMVDKVELQPEHCRPPVAKLFMYTSEVKQVSTVVAHQELPVVVMVVVHLTFDHQQTLLTID